jgi:hypothetical protein
MGYVRRVRQTGFAVSRTRVQSERRGEQRGGRGDHERLGHLILRPSSQRMYSSSAIGLRRGSSGLTGVLGSDGGRRFSREPPPGGAAADELAAGSGIPEISSSSVTTRPLAVSSLRRTTRLCGKSPRVVVMCCRMAAFLSDALARGAHPGAGQRTR